MNGKIIDQYGEYEIVSGKEGRIRFLLRPFSGHPLFETVVKAIMEEFKGNIIDEK